MAMGIPTRRYDIHTKITKTSHTDTKSWPGLVPVLPSLIQSCPNLANANPAQSFRWAVQSGFF